jgi:hypothetical protein
VHIAVIASSVIQITAVSVYIAVVAAPSIAVIAA